MKIDHARRLLEIYGRSITVAEVAEACGFEDAVYFSKRFKQFTGVSPEAYKKQLVN
jgi:AraC-like DNA-binding protein